jgi:hypothetical protein
MTCEWLMNCQQVSGPASDAAGSHPVHKYALLDARTGRSAVVRVPDMLQTMFMLNMTACWSTRHTAAVYFMLVVEECSTDTMALFQSEQ